MARVECEIEESLIEVAGKPRNGIVITCERCGHCAEVAGLDNPANRYKALKLLRETCPEQEGNYYKIPQLQFDQGKLSMENQAED